VDDVFVIYKKYVFANLNLNVFKFVFFKEGWSKLTTFYIYIYEPGPPLRKIPGPPKNHINLLFILERTIQFSCA